MALNSQSSDLNLVSETAFAVRENAQSDNASVAVIFLHVNWKALPTSYSIKKIGHRAWGGTETAGGSQFSELAVLDEGEKKGHYRDFKCFSSFLFLNPS